MPADASVYNSDRLARCYASYRPPIHEAICARLFAAIPPGHKFERAVDIGCGAGASTAALALHVGHATGIDPFERMLLHARHRYPEVTFLQGWAEALPLDSGIFGLVTAAGSLSYTNLDAALSEVSRVLIPGGYFAPRISSVLMRTVARPRSLANLLALSFALGLAAVRAISPVFRRSTDRKHANVTHRRAFGSTPLQC